MRPYYERGGIAIYHGRQTRRLPVPTGDIRLGDGLLLTDLGPFPDAQVRAAMVAATGAVPDYPEGRAWANRARKLTVIVSIDRHERHGDLLHVSLSHPHALPTWEEIRLVRDALFPDDVDVCMILPRAHHYVNFHRSTFHLTQMPVEWGAM